MSSNGFILIFPFPVLDSIKTVMEKLQLAPLDIRLQRDCSEKSLWLIYQSLSISKAHNLHKELHTMSMQKNTSNPMCSAHWADKVTMEMHSSL